MTLLINVFASIVFSLLWYFNPKRKEYNLGMLCLMFWGASLMWLCDAVAEYLEMGAEYFNAAPLDMINDSFLGLSVIAFGLIIWLITLMIKDPNGVIVKKQSQV